ncbi:putative selenium-dependent hydroxylase accessory protein YqeC [Pelotomaculum terephthalicicum JT]|uniref:selenium cofactor biosynthesis protein YqeC n=1 Tax=Pelotomaculum terephthalicicum TaxID=206393 RepID=UPI001F04D045|nr:selenium cofactor biosynthesis protein YqeC [Pelotomaculum terephthalicicum]MCG9966545.1 putative selenium-dependent hydroxylase accessory protein YqeC [Pelotomaculum terephthalicicum JT]
MKFIEAFSIKKGDVVALAGAGGKTTTTFAIGQEAIKQGWKVLLTTTTRIFAPEQEQMLKLIIESSPEHLLSEIKSNLASFPLVVAGVGLDRENKLKGLDKDFIAELPGTGVDLIIVEADGAAHKPFKAPREGEPVMPDTATLVVPVVGIDCLGKPLNREYTHRPEIIASLASMNIGELVTGQAVARVLLHSQGYGKDISQESRRWLPFINKVESTIALNNAREVAGLLGRGGAKRVAVGAAQAADPVIEVLAF